MKLVIERFPERQRGGEGCRQFIMSCTPPRISIRGDSPIYFHQGGGRALSTFRGTQSPWWKGKGLQCSVNREEREEKGEILKREENSRAECK
jgi:hypothetical protein